MKQLSRLFVFLFALVVHPSFAFCYSGPDDPEAVRAAEEAVKRLGPERGAINISAESVGIIGVRSAINISAESAGIIGVRGVGYSGNVFEINKDLSDLGAEKMGREVKVSLAGDILFDFDSAQIKKEAEETLIKLAKGIKDLGWKHILIEGHTDSIGSEEYNLRLSQRRAEAVKRWFIEKGGLTDVEFETKGYGESMPIAPNKNPDGTDNPEGRAKNRRVVIRITK